MGHYSINLSLTYLRGLEVAELKEEDMPMVSTIYIKVTSQEEFFILS